MPSKPPQPRQPAMSIWDPPAAVSSADRGVPTTTFRTTAISGVSFSSQAIS